MPLLLLKVPPDPTSRPDPYPNPMPPWLGAPESLRSGSPGLQQICSSMGGDPGSHQV